MCKLLNVHCGCSISFGWIAAVGLVRAVMEDPDSLQGNSDPRHAEDCAVKGPGCEHPTAAATQSLPGELLPLQILQPLENSN